jgi:hypothetical protein
LKVCAPNPVAEKSPPIVRPPLSVSDAAHVGAAATPLLINTLPAATLASHDAP